MTQQTAHPTARGGTVRPGRQPGYPVALRDFLKRPREQRRIGAFSLLESLGSGGFAPVWLAEEVYGTDKIRNAAVKLFCLNRTALDDIHADAIVEEAKAICRVDHPNVVRFYTMASEPGLDVIGIAMEYIDGESLKVVLDRDERLPVEQILEVGAAVASALAAVHRAGLVHRDVKPANVIRTREGYKLIDFGIAAAEHSGVDRWDLEVRLTDVAPPVGPVEREIVRLTQSVPLIDEADLVRMICDPGTAGYADPYGSADEGRTASPAADLYSLGATLFECATGWVPAAYSLPSDLRSTGELDQRVLLGTTNAPSIETARSGLPPELVDLVDRLLNPKRDRRPASAEEVARKFEWLRAARQGRTRSLPPEDKGPFRGLGRFDAADRDIFFGRTNEVAQVVEMLRGSPIVTLVGAPGSGKSSLIRAGVLPALVRGVLGGVDDWDVALSYPGRDARATLLASFSQFVPGVELMEPNAVLAALSERTSLLGRGIVVCVDQLEELAGQSESDGRRWSLSLLAELGARVVPGVRAIVAVNRAQLDAVLTLDDTLSRLLGRELFFVSPITGPTWRSLVLQALTAYGYRFEDDELKQRVLNEVSEEGMAMPLVQFALSMLWESRDAQRKLITRAAYDALGGVHGALDRHANDTLTRVVLPIGQPRVAARQTFLALTRVDGTRAIRKIEELSAEVGSAAPYVLETFEKAGLVIQDGNSYTLAHDSLQQQWGLLKQWIGDAKDDRLQHEELERLAKVWRAQDRDATLLPSGRRLVAALELLHGHVVLSNDATSLLREAQRAARRGKLRQWVAAGASVLTALFVVAWTSNMAGRQAGVEAQRDNAKAAEERARKAEAAAMKDKEEALRAQKKAESAQDSLKNALDISNGRRDALQKIANEKSKECAAIKSYLRALPDNVRPGGIQ